VGRRPMVELESTESRVVLLAASETPGSICSRDTMNRVMGSIMGKGKSWGKCGNPSRLKFNDGAVTLITVADDTISSDSWTKGKR
jgi:hypothetical protein